MTFARTSLRTRATLRAAALAAVGGLALAACSTGSSTDAAGGDGAAVSVVAAENFWGSIAEQVGGQHVEVTSIIDNPDADPHDYEPTPADGRAVATADLVVVNGVGYDTWATKLADANPSKDRELLDVGDLVGVPDDGNPHRWYDPADVDAVIGALVADYKKLDPDHAADYDANAAAFRTTGLAAYDAAIAGIKKTYAGTKIGASESIVSLIAPALGLDLITPSGFLTAVTEGTDPTAADKRTVDEQISSGEIAVYVYNSQNATPDIQAQVKAAEAADIPVTTITETLTPAGASFQEWQTAQLTALRAALDRAAGAQ